MSHAEVFLAQQREMQPLSWAEEVRQVFGTLPPIRRESAIRRLSTLASHVIGGAPAPGALAFAVPPADDAAALVGGDFAGVAAAGMLVPQPGTPAFQEWMRILYEEDQYFQQYRQDPFHRPHAYREPGGGGSRCLAMLTDWLQDTSHEQLQLNAGNEESAMSRRLRVVTGHMPQIADAGLMMTRGTRL